MSGATVPSRSVRLFPRIVCAIDGSDAAIDQAIAVAGHDSRLAFAASWYGSGSRARAMAADQRAREAVTRAVARAREAGLDARAEYFHSPTLGRALLRATAAHDLIVVGAHAHARAAGIVLGETATLLVHRSAIPVLIARDRPLESGVVAATRERPADRALTAATLLAARLGAQLTVVEGSAVRAILLAGDGAGLVVVGSSGRNGVSALASVSERVAHQAPCSVLVMRGA